MGCSQSKPHNIVQPDPINTRLALPVPLETECQMKALFEEKKKFYEHMSTFMAQQNLTNARILEELNKIKSRSNFFEDHVLDTQRRSTRPEIQDILKNKKEREEEQISPVDFTNRQSSSSVVQSIRQGSCFGYNPKRSGKQMQIQVINNTPRNNVISPITLNSPTKYFLNKDNQGPATTKNLSPIKTRSVYGGGVKTKFVLKKESQLLKFCASPLLIANNQSLNGPVQPRRPIPPRDQQSNSVNGYKSHVKMRKSLQQNQFFQKKSSFNQADILEKTRRKNLLSKANIMDSEVNRSIINEYGDKNTKFLKKKFEKKDLQNHQKNALGCSFDDASPRMKSKNSSISPKVNFDKKNMQNRKFISKTSTSSSSSFNGDELSIVESKSNKEV